MREAQDVQLRPLESDRFIWRWSVLHTFGVQGLLCGLDEHGRGQGTLACGGSTEGEVLLLDSLAWSTVDSGAEETAWTPVGRGMRLVRSA